MTEPNSKPTESVEAGDGAYDFRYGHGRMPFFMKLAWLAFLVFATWYVTTFFLTAVSEELGALG